MSSLVIVMPAYNESDGIGSFLTELVAEFGPEVEIIVVNDHSTDDTAAVVARLQIDQIRLIEAPVNRGHGPTTLAALGAGLGSGADYIMAVDGDGQFDVAEMHALAELTANSNADVVEGVRTRRGDPLFRTVTSAVTRVLVALRCWHRPQDANTPLRCYRRAVLSELVAKVPPNAMTPNLFISALVRRRRYHYIEYPVRSLGRRGNSVEGSTWGTRLRSLPTKRFVFFCLNAIRQWATTRI